MVLGAEGLAMTKEAEAMDIMLTAFKVLFDKMTPEERMSFKRGLFEGICGRCGVDLPLGSSTCVCSVGGYERTFS